MKGYFFFFWCKKFRNPCKVFSWYPCTRSSLKTLQECDWCPHVLFICGGRLLLPPHFAFLHSTPQSTALWLWRLWYFVPFCEWSFISISVYQNFLSHSSGSSMSRFILAASSHRILFSLSLLVCFDYAWLLQGNRDLPLINIARLCYHIDCFGYCPHCFQKPAAPGLTTQSTRSAHACGHSNIEGRSVTETFL